MSSEEDDTISGDDSLEEIAKLVRDELQGDREERKTRGREEPELDKNMEPEKKKRKGGESSGSKKTEEKPRREQDRDRKKVRRTSG